MNGSRGLPAIVEVQSGSRAKVHGKAKHSELSQGYFERESNRRKADDRRPTTREREAES